MFDFWYALGASIVKPAILEKVDTSIFTLVPIVRFAEFDSTGAAMVDPQNLDQTVLGKIDKNGCLVLRKTLQDQLVSFQTPVCLSVYTASKFAQFKAVPSFAFEHVIGVCHTALMAAAASTGLPWNGNLSMHFVAALGLLLVDSDVTAILTGFGANPASAEAADFFAEFPLQGAEKAALVKIASDQNFSDSRETFTLGGQTPTSNGNWDHCGHVRTGIYANAERVLY